MELIEPTSKHIEKMDWFIRKKRAVAPQAVATDLSADGRSAEPDVSIPREKFILETRAADDDARLPVYGIYQRFQEDWETKGYKDATGFPETSYRENQKRVIVDKLRLAIKEALLRYDDKITEIESHINQAGQNGLVETLEKYRQERMKLVAHRGELDLLDKDAREIGEKTKAILISYDMGFTRGMVSLSNEIVNEIMNR